jgi:hypothetical protein
MFLQNEFYDFFCVYKAFMIAKYLLVISLTTCKAWVCLQTVLRL